MINLREPARALPPGLVLELKTAPEPELFERAREVAGRSSCLGQFDALTEHLFALADHHEPSYAHCLRVGLLAASIAQAEGGDDGAALLAGAGHDVGKVQVPVDILDCQSALSREQWSLVRRHPYTGYELLHRELPQAAQVAACHHWFQDKPYGPAGYKIGHPRPETLALAQLVYFTDFAEAMTTRRDASSRISNPGDLGAAREALLSQFPQWSGRVALLFGAQTADPVVVL